MHNLNTEAAMSHYILEQSEHQRDHDSLAYELLLQRLVREGDVEGMERMLSGGEFDPDHMGRMAPTVDFTRLSKRDPEGTFPQGRLSGIVEGKSSFQPYAKRRAYPAEFTGKAHETPLTFEDVRRDPSLAMDFTAQMTVEELARVSVCASAGWGMEGVKDGRIDLTQLRRNVASLIGVLAKFS